MVERHELVVPGRWLVLPLSLLNNANMVQCLDENDHFIVRLSTRPGNPEPGVPRNWRIESETLIIRFTFEFLVDALSDRVGDRL